MPSDVFSGGTGSNRGRRVNYADLGFLLDSLPPDIVSSFPTV